MNEETNIIKLGDRTYKFLRSAEMKQALQLWEHRLKTEADLLIISPTSVQNRFELSLKQLGFYFKKID